MKLLIARLVNCLFFFKSILFWREIVAFLPVSVFFSVVSTRDLSSTKTIFTKNNMANLYAITIQLFVTEQNHMATRCSQSAKLALVNLAEVTKRHYCFLWRLSIFTSIKDALFVCFFYFCSVYRQSRHEHCCKKKNCFSILLFFCCFFCSAV